MRIDELEVLYDAWIDAIIHRTHFKKADFYKEDYIFDENMPVKWNREKVIAENQRMENTNKLDQERVDVLKKKYDDALNQFLLTDSRFGNGQLTEKQLEELQGFMMEEFEDDMNYDNGFYNTMRIYEKLIKLIFTCMKG